MKFLLILILILISISASAQSLVAGGFSFGSVVGRDDAGYDQRVGGFGEITLSGRAGLRLDLNTVATLEYAPKATTSAGSDFKLRPELRAFAPIDRAVKPFVGAGVQYNYFHTDQYGKNALNVVGTAGAEIASHSTVRLSRVFTDKTNNENRLRGWRVGYDLTRPFPSSTWAIRFSAEFNRFTYEQPFGPTAGVYRGNSIALRIGVGKAR